MNVLPPGWEVPDTLPGGVTVAPAADPMTAARVIAERVGGELVVDVAAAERALAREAARRRAEEVVADAAEAASLVAMLEDSSPADDKALLASADTVRPPAVSPSQVARLAAVLGDLTADPSEVRAAAARLRSAEVAAEAATRAVGPRPHTLTPEIDLVRARSLVADLTAADDESGSGSAAAGVMAMACGLGLIGVAAGVPVAVGAVPPCAAVARVVATRRQASRALTRRRVDAVEAAAAAEHADAQWARVQAEERAWTERAAVADAARSELAAARAAWADLAGEAPVDAAGRLAAALEERARLASELGVDPSAPTSHLAFELRRVEQHRADVDAARSREAARVRLHDVLHGRPLDRLRADAERARALLATPAPTALVLCDPFASMGGRTRRRAFLADLERAPAHVALAVVTSDDEALAWAAARARVPAAV